MGIASADVSRLAHSLHGNARVHASEAPDLIPLPLIAGSMRIARSILRYETAGPLHFMDITEDVERVVATSGIGEGWVTVFSRHTTAAIRINEYEPELLKDLSRVVAAFAPETGAYFHNDFSVRSVNMTEDECPNGHAHCQHLLLGTSETIPIMEAKLMVGRWQRIFLIELDHGRTRDVVVTAMGCDGPSPTAAVAQTPSIRE
jgi:secondary thiamine-phosphate synthase enzyme